MNIIREHYLTLQFNADSEIGNEIKLIKSVFKKIETIASRAGFKRDFNPNEIELIKALHSTLEEYENKDKANDSAML